MDIAILAAAVIGCLQGLGDGRRFSKGQRQSARIALSDAFHETEGYYAILSAEKSKDPVKEHRIAYPWEQAAIYSEQFNPSLASRLGLKSRYWL